MINKETIYKATNGGLDVFRLLWDDAKRLIDNGDYNKNFKIRPDERTGSAHLKHIGQGAEQHWVATDFGDDGIPRNCFDWVIKERNLQGFKEAVAWIVTELNLDVDDIKPERNKPLKIEKVPTETPEGTVLYELRKDDTFTKREIEVFGELVTQEVMESLNWHPVAWCGVAKGGMVTKVYSCDDYPIYARECKCGKPGDNKQSFYKIYKPLEFNKAYRFMVAGKREHSYVNGLYELREAYGKFRRQQEQDFDSDPANEGKTLEYKRFKAAVMASGERDCAAVKALGGFPIWLNSETDELEAWQEKQILQCADVIYNIPDKDETGLLRGKYHALRHLDIRTVWLPDYFQKYHDNRHHFRKDFKDFTEVVEDCQATFNRLLDQALPATFWTKQTLKNGKEKYEVNSVSLLYFMRLNGYHKLRDRESGETTFIRIDGNVVRRVTPSDMTEFLIRWSQGKECIPGYADKCSEVQPVAVQNLIIDSPKCSPSALEKVETVELDFTNYTNRAQFFPFRNGTVMVTASGIEFIRKQDAAKLKFHVWEDQIIPHDFKPLPPMFEVKKKCNGDNEENWEVSFTDERRRSNILGFLINSSRLFWRKEMEAPFEDAPDASNLRRTYRSEHKFEITSPALSEEENSKQMRCLANKLFIIGYFGWGYKQQSRSYAAFAMDWKLDEMGEANGGTGKSFLFEQVLPKIINATKLDGKQKNVADSNFKFATVTRYTRMVLVDDLFKDFPFETFYSNITGGLTVNPKNLNPFFIPFEQSPKFAFTTNYVPKIFDGSSDRRMLYMVNSDYYHTATQGSDEYHETRTIRDDFDKDLMGGDYSEEEWNADFNLLLQCVRFYISLAPSGVKIQPPMDNIMLRSSRMTMADKFTEWASEYFSVDSGRLDVLVERDVAINDFRTKYNMKDITTNMFYRKMKAFVAWCSYTDEFNPKELCATSKPGHILRRKESISGGAGEPTEYIYIRTNREALEALIQQNDADQKKISNVPLEGEKDQYWNSDEPF